jgi:hypothetical protein
MASKNEPVPEDSTSDALQKMFPDRPADVLQQSAKFLEDNFGVMTYDDLGGASAWAQMGMSLVVGDDTLSLGAKSVLQGLLLRKINEGKQDVTQDTSAGYSAAETPLPARAEAPASVGGTARSEDTVATVLQEMFPDQPRDAAEAAAAWLKEKFGIEMRLDLDGAEAWAETAMQVLEEDENLDLAVQEMLEGLFDHLTNPEPPAAAAEVPLPDDSVTTALRKMYPTQDSELLANTATWLETNFGVALYEDLEGAGAWAGMAMDLVAGDSALDDGMKVFLQEDLLKRLASPEESSDPSAANGTTTGPRPEDSVLAALEKMFPDRPLAVIAPAASWLDEKFSVQTYADFDGAGIWAEMGLEVVAKDDSLSSESRGFLQELLGQLSKKASDAAASSKRAEEPPPKSDRRSKDDFDIVRPLGEGSYAQVYSVIERSNSQKFALKEIELRKMCAAEIQQEVDIHRSLDHPHVLRCFESFEEFGNVYVLLELAEGGDLYHHMQDAKRLKEDEAAKLFSETASALHYIHFKGLMHRDMKPENILLDAKRSAKIGDFGCCTAVAGKKTQECGTPAYFAPEMCAGHGYDHRVDVWAMGILLYEMLVGHSPFSSALTELETKKRILKMDFGYGAWFHVPVPTQALLKLIMTKDPDERLSLLDALNNEWIVSFVGNSFYLKAKELEST